MDNFIIMPDDKTIEKLATEYSKVKAKTFSDNMPKVKSFGINRKYKMVEKNIKDNAKFASIMWSIIDASEASLDAFRKIKTATRNSHDKTFLRNIIRTRTKIMSKLYKVNLHGQIRTMNNENNQNFNNLSLKKKALLNQLILIENYTKLIDELPFSSLKSQIKTYKNIECEIALKIMLMIV